jgi:hypothetical protein
VAKAIPKIPEVISCLISQDGSSKRWIGHCLDFNLVTSGKDPDKAWAHLCGVIKVHVEHCFTHHHDGLKFRAADEHWQLFENLKKKQKMMRTEKITLRLVERKDGSGEPPFWVQGVEAGLGGTCVSNTAAAVPAVH